MGRDNLGGRCRPSTCASIPGMLHSGPGVLDLPGVTAQLPC